MSDVLAIFGLRNLLRRRRARRLNRMLNDLIHEMFQHELDFVIHLLER